MSKQAANNESVSWPSPLRPVTLDLSGERLIATYLITGDRDRARTVADQLAVEQTIEFPPELVPDDDITNHIVGWVEALAEIDEGLHRLTVSFAAEIVGAQFPQLLNVLFGNISLVPGVRLVDVVLPDSLLASFPGPRHGIEGLRRRFGRPSGPILATALKPMGTPIDRLAAMAYDLAAGGIDLIKDDHSFATQPFAPFRDRVPVLAAAVARANADTGGHSVYLPALNVPAHEVVDAAAFAVDHGAGGIMVLPGLFGFDTMRWVAETTPEETVIMAHPALLGSYAVEPSGGIAHDLLFGLFARLGGADVTVFPNYGGRFSFSEANCRSIAESCVAPLGSIRSAWPSPAGGMSVERTAEMIDFYGGDVCLLIGGGLYHGDIPSQVARMVVAVSSNISPDTTKEERHG